MRFVIPAALSALILPSPVFAQAEAAPEQSIYDGSYLTIGVGAVYGPSYEGSDDMVVTPVPVVQGKLGGIEITPRPGGVALDLLPDAEDPTIGFSLGPVVTYSGNRRRQIEDPVVRSAGKLKSAIDAGVNAGMTVYKLLHEYDSLTASVDAKWNVNQAHRGMTVTPQVSYVTPLSRASIVTLSLSATHVDDDYADYYYSVSPAQSAASGLPVHSATGGWNKWSTALLAGYDLNGDLLDGGFAVFALGSYSRMLGDARRTPYTSIRGDADQWMIGGGIGYTF